MESGGRFVPDLGCCSGLKVHWPAIDIDKYSTWQGGLPIATRIYGVRTRDPNGSTTSPTESSAPPHVLPTTTGALAASTSEA